MESRVSFITFISSHPQFSNFIFLLPKGFEFLQHFFLCRHGFALGNDQRALPNMLALPAPKDVCVKAKLNLSQC